MTPLEEIAAERERQRKVEGWTLGHDDEHADGSLASAAACYAYFGSLNKRARTANMGAESHPGFLSILRAMWPRSWHWQYWNPKDRKRDLVRAGALIVAELERLERAEKRHPKKKAA